MKRFIAIALAFACANSMADETTLAAGFGLSNGACGTGELTGTFSYDRSGDELPAHFRMSVGPNGSCSDQGVSVDASVAKRTYLNDDSRFFLNVAGGIDIRTVPFEYTSDLSTFKTFRGYGVIATQAVAGVGYDCGEECSVRLNYNVVENDLGELDASGDFKHVGPVELNVTYKYEDLGFDLSLNDTVQSLNVSWDQPKFVITGSVTTGASDLRSDALAYICDGAGEPDVAVTDLDTGLTTCNLTASRLFTRADGPDPLYSTEINFKF